MEISKIAQVALSKWKEYIKNKKYETEWEYVDKTPSKKYCYRDGFIDGYTFLENENTELNNEIAELKKSIQKKKFIIGQLNVQLTELEAENAELRRNEFNARSCLELQQTQDKAILNYMGEQLTKAKEIIRAYMLYCKGETQKYKETEKKAEQFLKGNKRK